VDGPGHKWFGRIFLTAICAFVMGLTWLAFLDHLQSRRRAVSKANLQRIAAALYAYHDQYSSFPPAYVLGPDGERHHSWRVLLLPFLGQEELYRQYDFGEPWNGPRNQALTGKMPDFYASPASPLSHQGVTNYLAVVGRATAWPEQYSARIQDIHDGTSNTILLVESADSEILWLEPRDLPHREALQLLQPGNDAAKSAVFGPGTGFYVSMADAATRWIRRDISRDVLRSLLSINGGRPLAGVEWPADPVPAAVELPPSRPAEDFRVTEVLPHPAGPIVSGRNYVYCATFAIAWEEACRECGGRPLRLAGDPPLATELNRHTFDRQNLSANSYIARAGPGTEAFRKQVREEMARKFPGSRPRLLDPDRRDHVLEMYAYLLKSLPFSVAFDALPKPLWFRAADHETAVASFGAVDLQDDDARGEQIQSQVTILDYVSDNDFILQLAPREPRDEIVLSKVAPAATLEEAIAAVRRRIADPDPQYTDKRFLSSESLAVPKLLLCVERQYSEIIDLDILGADLFISVAAQVIKFQLNETGALLESEAVIIGDNGHTPHTPAGKRKFIFDRPFLIYLIERDADQPYFAAWIENTELMEPVRQ